MTTVVNKSAALQPKLHVCPATRYTLIVFAHFLANESSLLGQVRECASYRV